MGLAERRRHPDDRRKHAVHLTARGQRTLERARKAAMEMAQEVFAPLDAGRARDAAPRCCASSPAWRPDGRRELGRTHRSAVAVFVTAVTGMSGETRRTFLVGGGASGVWPALALGARRGRAVVRGAPAQARRAAAAAAVVGSPPLRNAGYWGFADWLQPAMDRLWSESRTSTRTTRASTPRALMTHAIAAFEGHDGRRPPRRARAACSPRACASRRRSACRATGVRRSTPTRARRPSSTRRGGCRAWPAATARCTCRSIPRWHAPSTTRGARASSSACPPELVRADGAVRALGRRARRSSATRTCASTRSTSPPSCTPARSA